MSEEQQLLAAQDAQDGEMTVIEHLDELRSRIIKVLLALLVGSSVAYYYSQELIHFITAPAGKLYYMNPAEAFFSYLQVSIFVGFLISSPIIAYQVWAFIVPALSNQEKRALIFLVPLSLILFAIGLVFSYYLALPAGIKFFMGFASEDLQPLFSLGQYLSFVLSFLLPFGFIFELPLIIIVLAKLGFVNSAFLKSKRKVVFVLSFVVGALIAPTPDVISQCMVAIPLIMLYEMSRLVVKIVLRK